MNDSTPDPDLGPDAAERLLDAAARGAAPTTDPLAALLTAAITPDHDRALAGEEAALAHFRAAQQHTPTPNKRHRRAIRITATAILIALGLSGIAIAADTRPQTPLPHQSTPTPSPPNPQKPPNPTPEPHPSSTQGIAPRPIHTGKNIISLPPPQAGHSAGPIPQQANARLLTALPTASRPHGRGRHVTKRRLRIARTA